MLSIKTTEYSSEELPKNDERVFRKYKLISFWDEDPYKSVDRFIWQEHDSKELKSKLPIWSKLNRSGIPNMQIEGKIIEKKFDPIQIEISKSQKNISVKGRFVLFKDEYEFEDELWTELLQNFKDVIKADNEIKTNWMKPVLTPPDFKKSYKEQFKDIKWKTLRLKIFTRDKHRCQMCGITKYKSFPNRISNVGDPLLFCVQSKFNRFILIVANSKLTSEFLFSSKIDDLQLHHKYYESHIETPWDYPDEALITLCESCHSSVHKKKIGKRKSFN